jgi:hypothetical protein
MKLLFPYTNPIVFDKSTNYRSYKDLQAVEKMKCYVQPFLLTDRLSFQFSWREFFGGELNAKIILNINGTDVNIVDIDIDNTTEGGIYPEIFYRQQKVGRFYYSGVFCFSRLFNELTEATETAWKPGYYYRAGDKVSYFGKNYICIADIYGTREPPTNTTDWQRLNTETALLSTGDELIIKVKVNANIYESNPIEIISSEGSTKLISYNNIDAEGDKTFYTYFYYMPRGYNIRLPATFGNIEYSVEKEIFFNYKGKPELISAIVNDIDVLILGGKIGFSDDIVNNLMYILHCDSKKIDGIAYELIDSDVEVQKANLYNNRFIVAKMMKKEVAEEYIKEISGTTTYLTYFDERKNTGEISIVTNKDWYLYNASGLTGYTFTPMLGEGAGTVTFTALKNMTAETIYTTVEVRDKDDDTILTTLQLELPPITKGIGIWTIGETFYISEENYKYEIMNKEELKTFFEYGDMPTAAQLAAFIDACVTILDETADLPPADATTLDTAYLVGRNTPLTIYKCEYDSGTTTYNWVNKGLLGTGVTSYNDLTSKPKINDVSLAGNKTAAELFLAPSDPTSLSQITNSTGTDIIYIIRGTTLYKTTVTELATSALATKFPFIHWDDTISGTGTNIGYTIAGSKIGDVCINATSWDVYSCVGTNLWDYKGNIEGAKGDPGEPMDFSSYTEETFMEDYDYVVIFKNWQPCVIRWDNLKNML